MGEVFTTAGPVWLWTGRYSKCAKHFVHTMRSLDMMRDPAQTELDLDSEDGEFLANMGTGDWKSITKFLKNQLWHRIWTLQEIVMSASRGQAVLRFGHCEMHYDAFNKGVQALIKAGTYLILLNRRLFLASPMNIFPFQFGLKEDFGTNRIKITGLVYVSTQLVATDPRDQLYGLLGILPGFSP